MTAKAAAIPCTAATGLGAARTTAGPLRRPNRLRSPRWVLLHPRVELLGDGGNPRL
ncbi:MAG TPA: hypothetical protein VF557_18115 [Jatrophihabitans sp.]